MHNSDEELNSWWISMQRRLCAQSTCLLLSLTIWGFWILWSSVMIAVDARPIRLRPGHPAAAAAAAGSSMQTTAYGCPRHPIFNNPWVKNNIVLTHSLIIRDGLGGQVSRIMGVYAIAAALGLGYLHSPFECIGHIGPYPHYRHRSCSDLESKDQQQLQRVVTYLSLPSTTAVNVTGWDTKVILLGGWAELAAAVEQAVVKQQPTVIKLEMMTTFINQCPDMFHHVPSWRPRWLYDEDSDSSSSSSINGQLPVPASPVHWLLGGIRPVRICVHMRRGDLSSEHYEKRGLHVDYYINVVTEIIKILRSLNRDFTVEWFTEPSSTPEGQADIARIHEEVPNLSIHLDTDLLWNWHQMASTDIFVMSLSAYSFVPAVVNAQGLMIRAKPSKPCRTGPGGCKPSNWLEPKDNSGVLSKEVVDQIYKRWGGGALLTSAAAEAAAGGGLTLNEDVHGTAGVVQQVPQQQQQVVR